MKVCNIPGCPNLFNGKGGRCTTHSREARAARTDNRVYTTPEHRAFRLAVLTRDPVCVLCHRALATVADHYPRSRKQLVELGLDPNDPQYGRGLDARCHNAQTALNQPGGWNAN